jgi:hypothetical protein
MEIEVQVTKTIEVEVDVTVTPVDGRLPGPPGPRYRFLFSDELVLERIDDKDSGNGLPHSPQNRLAGTHSGFSRRRLAAAESSQHQPADPRVRLLTAQSIKDKKGSIPGRRNPPWLSLGLRSVEQPRNRSHPWTHVCVSAPNAL